MVATGATRRCLARSVHPRAARTGMAGEATDVTAVDLPRHFVSVAAVVVDDRERVLAIRRRDNGAWEPPGGVLQRDERIEDGVLRETAEEAGVHVDIVGLSGVYKNIDRGIVSLVYRCRYVADVDTDWAETVGVRWMDRGEVAERMAPVFAARVFDVLDRDPTAGPAVRDHDGLSFFGEPDHCLSVLNAYRRAPDAVKRAVRLVRWLARRTRPRGRPVLAVLTLAWVIVSVALV